MVEQSEFFKTVREGFSSVQAKASQRFEALEGDARKALNDLVEKGKLSQKDLFDRLGRLTKSPVVQERVKPAEEALRKVFHSEYRQTLEDLTLKVRETRHKARNFVGATSRDQALALAGELRKFADRLEKLAKKAEAAPAESPAPETH